ncbi:MAG: hypothetical protein ACC642_07525, partial [Pseudomonadales bacterium]
RLLDTLQAFGIEALSESDCLTDVRRAFVDHYTAVAVEWGKRAQLVTVTEWFENLGPDIPNFQAALPLAREHDIDSALLMIDHDCPNVSGVTSLRHCAVLTASVV